MAKSKSNGKIKNHRKYWLVLHKRDWAYKPAVIVPVITIKQMESCFSVWWKVKQVDFSNYLIVHEDWLSPTPEKAQDLLFNMKQWEKRWLFNSWRNRLRKKTVKEEIAKEMAKLSNAKRKLIMKQFSKVYPDLLNKDGTFADRKIKMKVWDKIAWAVNATKHPLREIWETEVKDGKE